MCAKVIIASVTRDKLQTFYIENMMWLVFNAAFKMNVNINFDLALWGLLLVQGIRYFRYVVKVINQIASFLEI